MKILYAIQGTGNGHLSRAKEIVPALKTRARVDVMVSGTSSEITLPFEVKYRYKGIGFVFGKNGGIDYWQTLKKNNIFRILKEIKNCKISDYDLVINDFEPISAWASVFKNVKCISLSHQGSLFSKKVPQPGKKRFMNRLFLRFYAPSDERYGFHFMAYDEFIFPAVIRNEIRKQTVREKKYYTVYLPSYSDKKIIKILSQIKRVKWKVFSKEAVEAYRKKNVLIYPVKNDQSFEKSLAWSAGIICGAGFETPAEALFLKKKLLVIPMKGQFEQAYNAAALKELGVPVLHKLSEKQLDKISEWVDSDQIVQVQFPDKTQFIIDKILTNHILATELSNEVLQNI